MYMSGDEADPARLLGAQLDVREVRGGDDVGAALRIAEAQVAGVLLEGRGDLLPHLVGAGGGVEAQLTTGVDDADANFHAISSDVCEHRQLYRLAIGVEPAPGPISPWAHRACVGARR